MTHRYHHHPGKMLLLDSTVQLASEDLKLPAPIAFVMAAAGVASLARTLDLPTRLTLRVVEDAKDYVELYFPREATSPAGPSPPLLLTPVSLAAFYVLREVARIHYLVEALWEKWLRYWVDDFFSSSNEDVVLATAAAAAAAATLSSSSSSSSPPCRQRLKHKIAQTRALRDAEARRVRDVTPVAVLADRSFGTSSTPEEILQIMRKLGHKRIPRIVAAWAVELKLLSSSSSSMLANVPDLKSIYQGSLLSTHVPTGRGSDDHDEKHGDDGDEDAVDKIDKLIIRGCLDDSPLRAGEEIPVDTPGWIRRHRRIRGASHVPLISLRRSVLHRLAVLEEKQHEGQGARQGRKRVGVRRSMDSLHRLVVQAARGDPCVWTQMMERVKTVFSSSDGSSM